MTDEEKAEKIMEHDRKSCERLQIVRKERCLLRQRDHEQLFKENIGMETNKFFDGGIGVQLVYMTSEDRMDFLFNSNKIKDCMKDMGRNRKNTIAICRPSDRYTVYFTRENLEEYLQYLNRYKNKDRACGGGQK